MCCTYNNYIIYEFPGRKNSALLEPSIDKLTMGKVGEAYHLCLQLPAKEMRKLRKLQIANHIL